MFSTSQRVWAILKVHPGRSGAVSITVILLIGSLVVVAGLVWLALMLRSGAQSDRGNVSAVVRVYCAAGVAQAMDQVRIAYQANSPTAAEIARTGGSGELLGQIQAERESGIDFGADVFISADDHLIQQGIATGLFSDRFPLARQRPVIAVRADSTIQVDDLQELIAAAESIPIGIAQRSAAIGELTYQIAHDKALYEELVRQSRLEAENVMMLAQALAAGSLDAAILWDSTVLEVNRHRAEPVLRIATFLDDDGAYMGLVSAGIVATAQDRLAVKDFVDFLTAPDGGLRFLASAGFDVVDRPLREELSR